MFAESVDINPDLIGQSDLFDDVAQAFGRANDLPGNRVGTYIAKGKKPDFHCGSLDCSRVRLSLSQ